MSFTRLKREQIKQYILEKIDAGQKDVAKHTAAVFSISLNSVYRYIRQLEEEKRIEPYKGFFRLITVSKLFTLRRERGELANEDLIYRRHLLADIRVLPANVQQIWEYSFMEMMNNAIEHSQAGQVQVLFSKNDLYSTILIQDNGIGIFRKIREYYDYQTLDDAVNELFKGKLTTDSVHHSGEGIFFTSRILDTFALLSEGKIFTYDRYRSFLQNLADIKVLSPWSETHGTIVYMELSNHSQKILREVFDMFSDADGGFTKTSIPIKNIYDTYPVSRSQARRLCNRFDDFQEVILDFSGIEEIGQGFAHEIFVVFQKSHPHTVITPQHTSPEIERMIYHVLHS